MHQKEDADAEDQQERGQEEAEIQMQVSGDEVEAFVHSIGEAQIELGLPRKPNTTMRKAVRAG